MDERTGARDTVHHVVDQAKQGLQATRPVQLQQKPAPQGQGPSLPGPLGQGQGSSLLSMAGGVRQSSAAGPPGMPAGGPMMGAYGGSMVQGGGGAVAPQGMPARNARPRLS